MPKQAEVLHELVTTVLDGIRECIHNAILRQCAINAFLLWKCECFEIGLSQLSSLLVETFVEHIGTSEHTFGSTLCSMTVATGGCTMLHQVLCAHEVSNDVRPNHCFSICLRTWVWSSSCPVCRNVSPELRTPHIEQATHEVCFTQELISSRFIACPVECVNRVDDGTGTSNTHVSVVPSIVENGFLVHHQVSDCVTFNVASTTGTVGIVRHDVVHKPRRLKRVGAELVHHAIQGCHLLVEVFCYSREVTCVGFCIVFGIEEVLTG